MYYAKSISFSNGSISIDETTPFIGENGIFLTLSGEYQLERGSLIREDTWDSFAEDGSTFIETAAESATNQIMPNVWNVIATGATGWDMSFNQDETNEISLYDNSNPLNGFNTSLELEDLDVILPPLVPEPEPQPEPESRTEK